FIKIVEIDDSTYFCHRFHPNAHLSKCLEREGFPSWGDGSKLSWRKQKNDGFFFCSQVELLLKYFSGNKASLGLARPTVYAYC
ncbi:MAG: hypothetical protein WBL87_02710, partial [Methanothrix sp.]